MSDILFRNLGRIKQLLWAKEIVNNHPCSERSATIWKPFHFQGKNDCAVLLVHGFTSTAYEMRALGERLRDEGYTVHAPLLRGHGTKPQDLKAVSWLHWMEDLGRDIESLAKDHKKVFIVGSSIGGALTLLLAQQKTMVSGVVVIGTPFRVRLEPMIRLSVRLLSPFRFFVHKVTFLQGIRSITRITSYSSLPLRSVREVFGVLDELRSNISKVQQPCYILQAHRDMIVHPRSADYIYDLVNSSVKRKHIVPDACHAFIDDENKEHIREGVVCFIREQSQ